MRIATAAAVTCLIGGISIAANVRAAIKKPTDIPAEQLELALQALAKDRQFQVIYRSEVVGQLKSHGARGNLTEDEALSRVLEQTGLTYRYLDDHTVTIVPIAAEEGTGSALAPQTQGTGVGEVSKPTEQGGATSDKGAEPEVGLVISYSYLWSDEAEAGHTEGRKNRPCAIILVVQKTDGNAPSVTVVPITHSPHRNPDATIEIPPAIKRHLGLDDQPSWIVLDDLKVFTSRARRCSKWPPVPGGRLSYTPAARSCARSARSLMLSDTLRRLAGLESLRYALLAMCPGYLWFGWQLWKVSKTVTRDLEAAQRHHAEIGEDGNDLAVALRRNAIGALFLKRDAML